MATAGQATLEGTLSKWTNVMKGWQYRFFVLDENAGLLSYYTSKEKMMKGVRRGCVRLKDAVIGIDDQEDNTFTITVDHKTFHFQAQHSEEREKWVRRLEDTIRRHANRSRLWDSQSTFYLGGYSKDLGGKRANHLELLGRRVSEADAYLQLMIEQTNKIEERIAEISDPEEKAKCKVLQDNASAMLDHIKHSIVSLQIAKNMAHPINGIYNGPTNTTPTMAMALTATSSNNSTKAAESNGEDDDDDDSTTENDILPQPLTNVSPPATTTTTIAIAIATSNINTTTTSATNTSAIVGGNFPRHYHQYQYQYTPYMQCTSTSSSSGIIISGAGDIVDPIADGIEYGTICDVEMNRQRAVDEHQQQQQEGADDREFKSSSPSAIAEVMTAPLAVVVPETSYSSSEGEEDFYDANDDPFTSLGSSPMGCATRGFSVETSPTHENPSPPDTSCSAAAVSGGGFGGLPPPLPELDEYETAANTVSDLSPVVATSRTQTSTTTTSSTHHIGKAFHNCDGSIDYDALYEEEEDTNISMEAHGSMISHLLSQVKIGMDLTKVVLPTFILERRSLLEMYADYFAHPDLFLKIAELDSPRDRIVQVCRWYMSAYHAGRKSAVAKKPYNPVLGEVFQCHWDIPDESPDGLEVKDGPIPWCHRDQLTFLAEQVSHHPPISAFYAEHYNKKITFSAHVWTKSKFLGLSIGVHNIGEGIVTLVDRSEEYIVTFPNGYGRSILTVPWIELGGSVEIRCPQTGYYANVEFLTKPFYGGKRNKVAAEVYAPNEKKPFVSIAGEWSGLMEAKWHDKNKTEVFVDVNRIPIFKKQVRPIVEQEVYESRRVWKEVTAGLKFNDIEKATNAKCEVEQIQRETAKARKESDEQWEHKYFKPVGENWIYTKPLSQRIYLQEKESKR